MGGKHTYTAWISTIAGIFNIVLIFLFLALNTGWEIRLIMLMVLGVLSLTSGLIARYGSAKDNLGAAGIVLAIVAPLVCFSVMLD